MEREKYGFTIMVTGSFPVIVYDSIQEGQIKPRSQRIWSTPFGFPSHPSIFLTVIVFQRNLVCYSKGLQFLIFYPFEIDPSWLHPVQQLGNGLIFCYRVYWHSSIMLCHRPFIRSHVEGPKVWFSEKPPPAHHLPQEFDYDGRDIHPTLLFLMISWLADFLQTVCSLFHCPGLQLNSFHVLRKYLKTLSQLFFPPEENDNIIDKNIRIEALEYERSVSTQMNDYSYDNIKVSWYLI